MFFLYKSEWLDLKLKGDRGFQVEKKCSSPLINNRLEKWVSMRDVGMK